MGSKPLCPRTLRWCARKLRADRNQTMDWVMDDIRTNGTTGNLRRERMRAWAGAADDHADSFLEQARTLERKPPKLTPATTLCGPLPRKTKAVKR